MISSSLLALLVYLVWTLGLLVAIVFLRTFYSLSGRRRANQFVPSGDDVSPFSGRLCRAHANCYENLPIFGAIIVVAELSNHLSITDPLALYVVAARIGQSIVHLISTRVLAVLARFGFFLIQIGVLVAWSIQLLVAVV